MYPVSETFKTYIKKDTVSCEWHGTIVDTAGNSYNLTKENIVKNSSKITRKCSTNKLSIGTTCAAELQLNLFLDVDRYLLFGATVELFFTLYEGEDTEDVPMGVFTVSESVQTNGQLRLIGYDAMTKFDDVKFSALTNNTIKFPYEWLTQMCTACGVTLGMTEAQIKNLPNGSRKTGFADVVTDVKSWRDVLKYLGTYLGGYSYIGRDGKLYIKSYNSISIDTIPASFRYSSKMSDFRTTYDGVYGIFKEEGLQEYVSNDNEGGLVLDLGVNPFLQFTIAGNRHSALKEIIDCWNGVYYVPFEVKMPIVPYYDPGDVITLTENQAGEYDCGAITEVIYLLGGQMSISCTGDNPRLAEAQDRFTKSVEGLSSEYSNGQEIGDKNFWLLHTENDASISISSTKTLVSKLEWNQKTDVQKIGFMFTCEASLSATATVSILITVDDSETYEFDVVEEKSMKGKRVFNTTCGFRVVDKGDHSATVYMTVTDTPTLWSDMV